MCRLDHMRHQSDLRESANLPRCVNLFGNGNLRYRADL